MTRSELVRSMAARTGLGPADADTAVKAVLAAVAGAPGRGGDGPARRLAGRRAMMGPPGDGTGPRPPGRR